jgi:1,2-diacylglycerol 3-beta-galactosyltransferase
VAQALQARHGEQAQVELVDALAGYAPWPANRLSDVYPYVTRLGAWPWAAGYRLSDGPRQVALITKSCWPLMRASVLRLLHEHPADAIVCCHPILNHLAVQALIETGNETPLITLVIDLATAHPFWFAPGVTRCLVPTEQVRRRALACGLPTERVLVTGLPVSAHFFATRQDPRAVRQRLGLEMNLPVVLLVNGAEGMGSPYRLCEAIAERGVRAQLVVIAGRNERLRARLAAAAWPLPMRSEGFVDNMHEWMRAADLLVTKAGPSTIGEALAMGLPMVLSSALPGQERPNVDYVVRAGPTWITSCGPGQESGRRRLGGWRRRWTTSCPPATRGWCTWPRAPARWPSPKPPNAWPKSRGPPPAENWLESQVVIKSDRIDYRSWR